MMTLLLVCASCAVQDSLEESVYNDTKTIGLVYSSEEVQFDKAAFQGLAEALLSQGLKYEPALTFLNTKIKPDAKIKDYYKDIFASKGIRLVEMDFIFDEDVLTVFEKPENSRKKYYEYDLRFLQSQEVDQVLFVHATYGISVSYFSLVETSRLGFCKLESEIVNLSDNSIVYKDYSDVKERIRGKWNTPPEYKNIENSINMAIENALKEEKKKLKK